MSLRESVFETLIGDLEYHLRRARSRGEPS